MSLCKHAADHSLPESSYLHNKCEKQVIQTHPVKGFCWKTLYAFFLIPSPLFQGIMTGRPIFLISSYTSEEGMKEILGDLQSCVFVHSWLSVSWGDDSRYKVMENQDQVSRRCVDDGAISPHLWDHTIWFQVDIWQAMEFITIWLANFRVKFLVFPKQYGLTLLDRKMKKNMQKISTIVHIWLKIKNERGSEKFECF